MNIILGKIIFCCTLPKLISIMLSLLLSVQFELAVSPVK